VKGSDPNDDNPLEALNRAEWLEILMRVAKAKFGAQHETLAPAVIQLIEHMAVG
jgi:hypothetical protein